MKRSPTILPWSKHAELAHGLQSEVNSVVRHEPALNIVGTGEKGGTSGLV